jgi:hypothetical protein
MSLCEYCGEKAGWFQSSHPACVAKANSTGQTLKELVSKELLEGKYGRAHCNTLFQGRIISQKHW